MGSPLVIDRLGVDYETATGPANVVESVSLEVEEGEVFGLVGESGCGKSTLSLAVMGMLGPDAHVHGSSRVDGVEVVAAPEPQVRALRGKRIAMIVQDPLTSLDPTFSIGGQIAEAIRVHQKVGRRQAKAMAVELLERVGIERAAQRAKDPPHRFSGGMRQRVVIAMALANDPRVLIADEPTTALDVTVQAQILDLLRGLCSDLGTSMIMITHDLGVVAQVCDRVGVMYAGQLVEVAPVIELFSNPLHPYTKALLAAVPSRRAKRGELAMIAGEIPDLTAPPPGCRFAPRCPHRMDGCDERPELKRHGGSEVACWSVETGPADRGGVR